MTDQVSAAEDGQDVGPSPVPGTVSWLDLSAPDIDRAATFYVTLFSWSYRIVETPMGAYRVARLRGRDVAGPSPA